MLELLLNVPDCSVGFVLDEHGDTPLHLALKLSKRYAVRLINGVGVPPLPLINLL